MNKYLSIILLATFFTLTTNQAEAQVDSSFSYQGELQDSGVPANGLYDFQFTLREGQSGQQFGNTSVHLDTDVVNGLFSVNADFDIAAFDGFGDVYFDIEVRSSAVGGAYTLMGSQTIQSVPLATNLTNGDAMNGEVLTFNGFQWVPMSPASTSPWNTIAGGIIYSGGNVFVDGNFQVSQNASSKLQVNSNGGTTLGNFVTPPADGLYVAGDVKQSASSDGMMKYMVTGNCRSGGATITRSYNGINNSNITVANGATNGQCIYTFPTNINDRYWQASAVSSSGERGMTCSVVGANDNQLVCTRFNTTTGASIGGNAMVLVY